MNIALSRKIDVNRWVVHTRWFYASGILFIGFISRSISRTNVSFSEAAMVGIFGVTLVANLLFFLFLRNAETARTEKEMHYLSCLQILLEFVIFALVMHFAGGIESISYLFYFLPIVAASLLFGFTGAVVVAILAGLIVNGMVLLEYYAYLPHVARYGVATIEFQSLPIGLTKSITIAVSYLIIGFFSGMSSHLIADRERRIQQENKKLEKETEYRQNEWTQLDKMTKLLVRRDQELVSMNKELDHKVKELKRSEIAMMKAFADLKAERQRADDERKKTGAIIANFIDPIIVIDADSRINLLNPAAKEIFGLGDIELGKQVVSSNHYSMLHFAKLTNVPFTVKTAKELKSGNPNEEEVVVTVGGQELTYKATTAPVSDDSGKDLGVMKIFYNLTREKMIDKLKSEFISIAAHQLRTPLAAIKWIVKMVLDGDAGTLTEEQQKLLTKGYQSNERIIELVNDMLNVSRIEEGRFGYNFEPYSIGLVIEGVADSVSELIDRKHIKFSITIPPTLPPAYIDKQKMQLVIQNLIENAIKYTPDYGRITVTVESGDAFFKVRVADNGVGIPQKDQAKLFSKFFRAENVMRMQTEGSGLGLFIVRNVVKSHGGEITFESVEGSGTEFVFTIPRAEHKH